MSHLSKEFSMENLLFLTIMLQFQSFCLKHELIEATEETLILDSAEPLILPDIVPTALIFCHNKVSNSNADNIERDHEILQLLSKIFIAIYEKYIARNTAQLEVNISSKISKKLNVHYEYVLSGNVFGNFDVVWEDLRAAVRQINANLRDSHSRFDYHKNMVAVSRMNSER